MHARPIGSRISSTKQYATCYLSKRTHTRTSHTHHLLPSAERTFSAAVRGDQQQSHHILVWVDPMPLLQLNYNDSWINKHVSLQPDLCVCHFHLTCVCVYDFPSRGRERCVRRLCIMPPCGGTSLTTLSATTPSFTSKNHNEDKVLKTSGTWLDGFE